MKFVFLTLFASLAVLAQTTELLYPDGAPGAVGAEDRDKPNLTFYPAQNPNGAAVLICPGGGYGALAVDHEGKQVAEWLNSFGVSAFVLRYRLGPRYHHPAMLDDAKQAMRMIRRRAPRAGIDPAKVGVMGFSAGGHLASTLSTHFDEGARPDFSILCYPVITLTAPYVHKGSSRNLLGPAPGIKLVLDLSNERAVTSNTPPTFLFHTDNDAAVPVENSVMYYTALKAAGVPAEMHIYAEGRHGVGLAQSDPVLSSWPARLKDWMKVRGIIPK
ncbi:MAG: alpha/beta hydrolase [Bryobacterales bacterium]|nr:alpha/beta hydrolase [Bryobacterales bacterium]